MEQKRKINHWTVIALYLILFDIVALNGCYFGGLWIRFDCRFSDIPSEFFNTWLQTAGIITVITIIVFYFFKLYSSVWRFAGFDELIKITEAWLIVTVCNIAITMIFFARMPIFYYMVGGILHLICTVGVRFVYRFITIERFRRMKAKSPKKNAMIIGAGMAGQTIIREMLISDKIEATPVCIIDDNGNRHGRVMYNVPIVGGCDYIEEAVKKYEVEQIIFAIANIPAQRKKEILEICSKTECDLKQIPGIFQLANGTVSIESIKPVAVEDLLGREPIKVNSAEILDAHKGQTVLVTGGGGTIGSELCRQIAGHEPKELIIFDIYENNAYEIQMELKRKHPGLNLTVLIGSVRDSKRINQVFEKYKPDIVYHAAAHKHVPLMEDSPNEAIKNNVMGTYKTAYAALINGAKKFVLISTDKAVNPTNIMGASKRVCEMVIQSMDAISRERRVDLLPFLSGHPDKVVDGQNVLDPMDHIAVHRAIEDANIKIASVKDKNRTTTQFVAVRFGNVLGSNGSVIPLFKKQIAEGGPVTVTHPDIIRYFITIQEAVSLVLQAAAYARGGEIFVLDMGEPVKIDTLARNLIRLSGFTPDVDIKVEYTGLRPGEKLYEEKLMAEEGLKKTSNELIHIGKPISFDIAEFFDKLEVMASLSYKNTPEIKKVVADMVSTYTPQD